MSREAERRGKDRWEAERSEVGPAARGGGWCGSIEAGRRAGAATGKGGTRLTGVARRRGRGCAQAIVRRAGGPPTMYNGRAKKGRRRRY